MARKNALLGLQKRLIQHRDELKTKMAHQMEVVGKQCGPGDVGDQSLVDTGQELSSQLVALESRELLQVEKAIEALRTGNYGQCEYCEKQIPITRLQALPHSSCCIACQREHELTSKVETDEAHWESTWNYQAIEHDRELTVRDINMDQK